MYNLLTLNHFRCQNPTGGMSTEGTAGARKRDEKLERPRKKVYLCTMFYRIVGKCYIISLTVHVTYFDEQSTSIPSSIVNSKQDSILGSQGRFSSSRFSFAIPYKASTTLLFILSCAASVYTYLVVSPGMVSYYFEPVNCTVKVFLLLRLFKVNHY